MLDDPSDLLRQKLMADPASLRASGEINPQAGMPAEGYIKGEDRTPLQYLLEPLTQVMRRAAREQ